MTAASDWGALVERKRVRPGLQGSCEDLFRDVSETEAGPRFWLPLRNCGEAADRFREARLQRAIGVIYKPETERFSHYFLARLAGQFDVMIHCDETASLDLLELTAEWEAGELPEPYPFAD